MSAADGVRLYTAAELDPHVLAARKGATSVSVWSRMEKFQARQFSA